MDADENGADKLRQSNNLIVHFMNQYALVIIYD